MPLPGAVIAVANAVPGVSFKAPTPRTFGYLPSTLTELQAGVEGRVAHLNNRTYSDVETVRLMDGNRRSGTNVSGAQSVWTELLPAWSPTPAALALIRQLDPGFQPRSGSGSSAGTAPAQLSAEAPVPPSNVPTPGGILGTMPLWVVLALAGGIGYVAYKAIKKG